jgi:Zn-dependent protease
MDRNPYPPARISPIPDAPAQSTDAAVRDYAPIHPEGGLRSLARKIWAPLALIGALVLKFKTAMLALLKLKLLATSASMLVSVAGYAVFWGWKFAAGFVVLLLVHELGHVLEAKRQGLATGGVYFIPFLGAVMLLKQQSKNPAQAAWLGLAGPILGSAAAAATWAAGVAAGSDLLVALGFTGFLLNLFNLIPVMPLDGGWATAVFHPLFWAFGLIGVIVLFAVFPNPILLIVAAVGAWELWKRWRRRGQGGNEYRNVSPRQRATIAGVYLGLAGLLALGMSASHRERTIDGRAVAIAAPAPVGLAHPIVCANCAQAGSGWVQYPLTG